MLANHIHALCFFSLHDLFFLLVLFNQLGYFLLMVFLLKFFFFLFYIGQFLFVFLTFSSQLLNLPLNFVLAFTYFSFLLLR